MSARHIYCAIKEKRNDIDDTRARAHMKSRIYALWQAQNNNDDAKEKCQWLMSLPKIILIASISILIDTDRDRDTHIYANTHTHTHIEHRHFHNIQQHLQQFTFVYVRRQQYISPPPPTGTLKERMQLRKMITERNKQTCTSHIRYQTSRIGPIRINKFFFFLFCFKLNFIRKCKWNFKRKKKTIFK